MARKRPTNPRSPDSTLPLDGFMAAQISKSLEKTQTGKFHTKGGARFTAEDGNAMADRLRLRKVETGGLNNSANGANHCFSPTVALR